MRIIITSSIILLLASATAHAQKYIFKLYRFECSELYNIDLSKPKGFKVIDGITPFKVNDEKPTGMFYRMALESKAKDCLILFPDFNTFRKHNVTTKNMVYFELKAALNLNIDNHTLELDSAKYIKIITGDKMDKYFNADTVFIYNVPLPKPYKEIYSQCIGINVIKTGYPSAIIKILLTEDGKKKEEEYLNILFNSIHYGDVTPEITQEKITETVRKMKRRFIFSMKKYIYPGYVSYSKESRK